MLSRLTLLCALLGTFFALSQTPAQADTASDIKALQAAVKTLQSQVGALQTQNTSLQSQVNSLKSITSGFSRVTDTTRTDGKKGTELFLTGFNLHVVNGLGSTDQTNGLGNVVIGYNAARGNSQDVRTGSHNLIVDDYENYSSYGGTVVGYASTISGSYASVSGGYGNTASNNYASVSGGYNNAASGLYSSVSGGYGRQAINSYDWAAGSLYQEVDAC